MKFERIVFDMLLALVDKPVVTLFSTIPSRGIAMLRLNDRDGEYQREIFANIDG